MRVPGIEPGTSAMSMLRSNQVSYTRGGEILAQEDEGWNKDKTKESSLDSHAMISFDE